MLKLGITNGYELRKWSLLDLTKHFGKVGKFYYDVVRGIDEREVKTSKIRKSIGKENTFAEDISDKSKLLQYLQKCSGEISKKLIEKGASAKTVTLKIKYANFDVITKSRTVDKPIHDDYLIYQIVQDLLLSNFQEKRKIRLLGISTSNLNWKTKNVEEQLLLPFCEEYQ